MKVSIIDFNQHGKSLKRRVSHNLIDKNFPHLALPFKLNHFH